MGIKHTRPLFLIASLFLAPAASPPPAPELADEKKEADAAIPRLAACGFKKVHVAGGEREEKPGYTEVHEYYVAVEDSPTVAQLVCAAQAQSDGLDLDVDGPRIRFASPFENDFSAAIDRLQEQAAIQRAPPAQRAQVSADVQKIAQCGFANVKVLYDVWPTIQITTASATEAQRVCVAKVSMESSNGIVVLGPLQSAFRDIEDAMELDQTIPDLKACGFRKVHKWTRPPAKPEPKAERDGYIEADVLIKVDDSNASRKQLDCAVDAAFRRAPIDFTSPKLADAISALYDKKEVDVDRNGAREWLQYYGYSSRVPPYLPGKRSGRSLETYRAAFARKVEPICGPKAKGRLLSTSYSGRGLDGCLWNVGVAAGLYTDIGD